jgi:hypothetical protein
MWGGSKLLHLVVYSLGAGLRCKMLDRALRKPKKKLAKIETGDLQ